MTQILVNDSSELVLINLLVLNDALVMAVLETPVVTALLVTLEVGERVEML
jgi:hypothetical protein